MDDGGRGAWMVVWWAWHMDDGGCGTYVLLAPT